MKRTLILLLFIALLAVTGCREEIVDPNNPAGNVNDPIQYRSSSSYSFLINADNFSYKILVPNTISGQKYQIIYSLTDYSAGNASIAVFSSLETVVLNKVINENASSTILNVEGDSAKQLELIFYNFSGKLSVKLQKVQ